MSRPAEEIYKEISESLISKIKEPWKSIHAEVEIHPYGGKVKAKFMRTDTDSSKSFPVDPRVFYCFEELHKIMKTEGHDEWNRARLHLTDDGKFTVDFQLDKELAVRLSELSKI